MSLNAFLNVSLAFKPQVDGATRGELLLTAVTLLPALRATEDRLGIGKT